MIHLGYCLSYFKPLEGIPGSRAVSAIQTLKCTLGTIILVSLFLREFKMKIPNCFKKE